LVQPNQPQNSGRRDAKDGGGFTDGHLVAPVSFSLTVDSNSMAVAQRANMPRRPDLPMCCAALIPIQNCGDPRIWFDPRQCANNFHEIIVGDIAMPTSADLLKLYLRSPQWPLRYRTASDIAAVAPKRSDLHGARRTLRNTRDLD
jgi:hypothetical protein